MTDKAVSALTSLTGANTATGDLLYIVDISEAAAADRSKKITAQELQNYLKKFPATIGVGGATPAASGAGISFPATASASSDGNTLDDYEEGTWPAVLTAGTTPPTTPINATGIYTKIGNKVTAAVTFVNVDTTGAVGQLLVTGLPFAGQAGVNQIGSVTSYGLSIPNKTLNSWISGGTTSIEFVSAADNGAWSFTNITAGAAKYLYVTATYFV